MRYLVDFKNTATSEQIQQYLTENNCSVVQVWNNFEKIYLVETEVTPPVTDEIDQIVSDDDVTITPLDVQPVNFNPSQWCINDPSLPQIVISTQDQKDWWKNYILKNPEFDQDSVTICRKGSKVPVYIMDSGIKADHEEFSDVSISNIYSVTPGDFNDTNGHGTAIASVISGKTCGITSSPIKVVKIFSAGHSTLQSELLSALDAIIQDVPANTFAVVNCSWSIPRNQWIEQKLLSMINNGIFVIASAGNNGGSIEDVTPAAMPEVITVGSYGPELTPSNFSNYTGESHISYTSSSVNGGELDGWAPGENIWSAKLSGDYGYASGTSMSAAITSAILVYGLHDTTYSDGTRFNGYERFVLIDYANYSQNQLSWMVLSKADMLDLSNPKYEQSRNTIVCLPDAASTEHPFNQGITERAFTLRAGTETFGPRLFYSHEIKNAELISPLPENFEILPSGSLIGKPTLDQGPSGEEIYQIYNSKIRITYLSDEVAEIDIIIYVLSPTADISMLPNDHEIVISLSNICSNINAVKFCEFGGEPTTCSDFCNTFNGCCNPNNPFVGKDGFCDCY